jgi:hypothetical protein
LKTGGFKAHESDVCEMRVFEDRHLLISCSKDRTVAFWQLPDNWNRSKSKGVVERDEEKKVGGEAKKEESSSGFGQRLDDDSDNDFPGSSSSEEESSNFLPAKKEPSPVSKEKSQAGFKEEKANLFASEPSKPREETPKREPEPQPFKVQVVSNNKSDSEEEGLGGWDSD